MQNMFWTQHTANFPLGLRFLDVCIGPFRTIFTSDLETLFLNKKKVLRSLVKMQPQVENYYNIRADPPWPNIAQSPTPKAQHTLKLTHRPKIWNLNLLDSETVKDMTRPFSKPQRTPKFVRAVCLSSYMLHELESRELQLQLHVHAYH